MEKQKTRFIVIILSIFILATAWGQVTPTPGSQCRISVNGHVTNTAGQPIAEAIVTINTSSVHTDGTGYYSLSVLLPSCSSIPVGVSVSGYVSQTQYTPSLGGGGSYTIDFVLLAAGESTPTPGPTPVSACNTCVMNNTGYVLDPAGNPLAGAVIRLDGTIVASTDSRGYYQFEVNVIDSSSGSDCQAGDAALTIDLVSYQPLSVLLPLGCGTYSYDYTICIIGDVNGDTAVNIIDALMTARYYVGYQDPGFNVSAADVNKDNTINIIDALYIAQYYVGLIDRLPPG